MRVAVVGSRDYPDLERVRRYVRSLPPDTVVVSGGARGVDRAAVAEALLIGLATIVYEPNYELHGRQAPLVRNEAIAIDCDELIAFWDGRSRGTINAVGHARRLKRRISVINPDGEELADLAFALYDAL